MDKKNLKIVDGLKHELDAFRPLTADQIKNLKRLFDVDFSYNSTAIEGNTLSLNETRVVLLDGITIGGKTTREHLEILNHKEAIDYIEQLARKPISEYSSTDITNIHALVLKGIDPANAGIYRKVPVYVRLQGDSIHKFCEPLKIPDEMEAFYAWLRSEKTEHPVIIAAEAHTRFVGIHPFIDGNGRTACLIMNLVLLHHGFPPAIIKMSQRAAYLDAIEAWEQRNQKEPLLDLICAAVQESLELYLDTLKNGVVWK